MTPITLVHITNRKDPKWGWFVDSIVKQIAPGELPGLQFVFVDSLLWQDMVSWGDSVISLQETGNYSRSRAAQLEKIVAGRFPYLHVPPLPNAYNGPFRQTKRDWFYAGNSRNTGIVVADHPYIMFCDDLALPGPQWLAQVRHAAEHQYLLAGMYKKLKRMTVVDGELQGFEAHSAGVDSRWRHGSDDGIVPWSGAGVYGCSFGAPAEHLLRVDGNGEETAMMGAEDYCLGTRLERSGLKVFLNRNCFTAESEEDHYLDQPMGRDTKIVTSAFLPPGYEGNRNSDHVHLNRLNRERDRILPLIPVGLRAIHHQFHSDGTVPTPAPNKRDWRDDSLLSEL